jgi:non-specific serine/threonine protein kinase
MTSFVGRRNDVAAIRRLAAASRTVTLTGFGGLGKTRLALRAANEMRRAFRDGVCLVELAPLGNADLLPHTVIDALGLHGQSGKDPIQHICDELADRHLLLVLDNCEHVIDAAADLAAAVLAAAPEVSILATSRQPLRIAGEYLYPVAPLPLPDADAELAAGTATQYPALALLAERVAASVPDFTLTPQNEASLIRLCRQLEGIPLAIELAASRLQVLEIDELTERLRDRSVVLRERNRSFPERHRTLEALIDWSHDLCTPSERLLWARAAIFAGSFSLQALEAVCGDESLPEATIIDVLSSLVDRSIFIREVHGDRVRFRMLDTIRAYGQTRLAESEDQEAFALRHRDWYADLLVRATEEWVGPQQMDWSERLRAEHANLRLALEYSVSRPDEADIAFRMAGTAWFWLAMEYLREGRLWLARALALPSGPSASRAWALGADAYLAAFQGDIDGAEQIAVEARTMAESVDDRAARGLAAHILGVHRLLGRDPASAIPFFREGLELYVLSESPQQYRDGLLIEMGIAYLFAGDLNAAHEIFDDLPERCRRAGDLWQFAYALWGQAFVALVENRLDDAEPALTEGLAIKRDFQDTLGIALVTELLAWSSVQRDPERTACLFGVADSMWNAVGARQLEERRVPYAEQARAALGDQSFSAAVARGAAMPREAALAFALGEQTEADAGPTAPSTPTTLTARQREVAQMVAAGMSNKDIAAKLVISLRTAEGHVEAILTKLGFNTRTQIANWVHQQAQASGESNLPRLAK